MLELEHAMEWALDDKYLGLAEEETPDKMAPQNPRAASTPPLRLSALWAAIAASDRRHSGDDRGVLLLAYFAGGGLT